MREFSPDGYLLGSPLISFLNVLASDIPVDVGDIWARERRECSRGRMATTKGLTAAYQTKYMTADNINIGIGAIMETVEMTYVPCIVAWHLRKLSLAQSLRFVAHQSVQLQTLRDRPLY